MRKYSIIILLTCISTIIFAQDIKFIDNDNICEPGESDKKIEFVESFKDSLKLTLELETMTVSKKTEKIDFVYSEYIKDESSVIRITKNGALRLSIARVTENGKKYYLGKIHLYRKEGNCWEDITYFHDWEKISLGAINYGYGIGDQGTSNYIGYFGKVIIE